MAGIICVGAGTTAFILADYCWGMAAFRPERDPQLTSLVNTVMLLTSSLFVVLGTAAARAGNTADALRRFGMAFAFGAAFPVLKLFEWVPEISAGLAPGKNCSSCTTFVMTGMNLCHVLLGLVIMSFIIRNLKFTEAPKISFIETGATYWHMVDIVWLALFALLSLMRGPVASLLRNPPVAVWALLTTVTVASWLIARDGGAAHRLNSTVAGP